MDTLSGLLWTNLNGNPHLENLQKASTMCVGHDASIQKRRLYRGRKQLPNCLSATPGKSLAKATSLLAHLFHILTTAQILLLVILAIARTIAIGAHRCNGRRSWSRSQHGSRHRGRWLGTTEATCLPAYLFHILTTTQLLIPVVLAITRAVGVDAGRRTRRRGWPRNWYGSGHRI